MLDLFVAKKRRVEIIDIAKAVTIFLVIVGHTLPNLDTSLFRRTIYSFHMPLFFLLAGLSIKPSVITTKTEWLSFIKKNILALIVPCFIWGLVYGNFSFKTIPTLFYCSWEMVDKIGTLTSLWYLPCLFVARIIVQLEVNFITKVTGACKLKWITVAGIVTAIFGFFLPHPENGVFWCADIAVLAAGFVLFGMGIRLVYIILAQQVNMVLVSTFIVSTGLFFLCTYGRADALQLCLMCKADYGNIFWFFLISLLGSLAVLSFSWIVYRISRESNFQFDTRAITYIGSHTMGIFLLHKPFLLEVVVPFVSIQLSGYPFEFIALISSIIALLYSVIMCAVIEKFIPELLGKFPV